ncbi:hypothetical protein LZ32DRAFT_55006 [Colletotrichum eremochloae]|nr:hypothetical protein LZ32DRAFT_55006 [Colletotrichum eremochloae]
MRPKGMNRADGCFNVTKWQDGPRLSDNPLSLFSLTLSLSLSLCPSQRLNAQAPSTDFCIDNTIFLFLASTPISPASKRLAATRTQKPMWPPPHLRALGDSRKMPVLAAHLCPMPPSERTSPSSPQAYFQILHGRPTGFLFSPSPSRTMPQTVASPLSELPHTGWRRYRRPSAVTGPVCGNITHLAEPLLESRQALPDNKFMTLTTRQLANTSRPSSDPRTSSSPPSRTNSTKRYSTCAAGRPASPSG